MTSRGFSLLLPSAAKVSFRHPLERSDTQKLDIALVGVPYDGAVEARSGTRQGPRRIRDISSMMRAIHHVTRINPYE